jgi:sugar lactone lactonase YvrE
VWLQRAEDDGRRLVSTLPGTTWLAWQGPVLWAISEGKLSRSGGALLPWRPSFGELEGVAAVAGSANQLWMVLDDGTLAQHRRVRCDSPWQASEGSQGLSQPRGIAASERGWFVVADTQNHRVRWYTQNGTCLDSFGEEGQLPGQFREPSGVALAPDGTVAVADTWNGRVQLLRPDGTLQMVGDGLYGPRGVLWLPEGGLLVADTGNKTLLRYRPPRWDREEVYRFDAPVVGLSWIDGAVAAAVPAEGKVVILEPSDWSQLLELEVPGWSSGQQQEGYLAQTDAGGLLATAPDPGELWLLDPTGVTRPRLVGEDLTGATGITVLPDGKVLLSLTWESRLTRVDIAE